jgi:hypothetical protein
VIKITPTEQQAFDRVIKVDAFLALQSIFERQRQHIADQYEQSKESLVLGGDRVTALQWRGRLSAYDEILEMFKRQRMEQ